MITKLTKILGINYKGGKGVSQLNSGGEKTKIIRNCNALSSDLQIF